MHCIVDSFYRERSTDDTKDTPDGDRLAAAQAVTGNAGGAVQATPEGTRHTGRRCQISIARRESDACMILMTFHATGRLSVGYESSTYGLKERIAMLSVARAAIQSISSSRMKTSTTELPTIHRVYLRFPGRAT